MCQLRDMTHRLWTSASTSGELSAMRSTLEDVFAMVSQTGWVWFGKLLGQRNGTAFVGCKVLLQRRLREVSLQPSAENNTEVLVDRDQTGVVGGIVQARQTQTVSWIQALGGEI